MISTLTSHERRRLVRTTRKLGAMLGTTPRLEVEDAEKKLSSSAPHPKLTMALKTTMATTPALVDRPVLTIHCVGRRDRADSTDSITSPLSPTHRHHHSEPGYLSAAHRRQNAAKLSRTLGENIPPELIFTSTPRLSTSSKRDKARRRRSGSLSLESLIETATAAPAPVYRIEKPIVFLDICQEEDSIHSKSSTPVKDAFPPPSPVRSASFSGVRRERRGRANSDVRQVRSQTHMHLDYVEEELSTPSTHRKGPLWSGEWNRKDMESVLRDLRNL